MISIEERAEAYGKNNPKPFPGTNDPWNFAQHFIPNRDLEKGYIKGAEDQQEIMKNDAIGLAEFIGKQENKWAYDEKYKVWYQMKGDRRPVYTTEKLLILYKQSQNETKI